MSPSVKINEKSAVTCVPTPCVIPDNPPIKQKNQPGIPKPNPTFPVVVLSLEAKNIVFNMKLGIRKQHPKNTANPGNENMNGPS